MENILAILSLGILFAGCAISERITGKEIAVRCYTELATNGDITSLFIDVSTAKQIASFCSRVPALKKCISENEHHLSLEENTEYQLKASGVTTFYLNVCPPGADLAAKYKANAPCFQLIKNHILECGSDLPDLSTFKMKSDRKARCCALVSHHECMVMVTSERCGSEAGETVNAMMERYFQNDLKECTETSTRDCFDIGDHFSHPDFKTTRGNEGIFKKTTLGYPSERRGTTEWEDWSQTTAVDDWKSRPRFSHKPAKSGANCISSTVFIDVLICITSLLLRFNFCKLL